MDPYITEWRQIPTGLHNDKKEVEEQHHERRCIQQFSSIGTNYQIVAAKLRLSLRANGKTPVKNIKYDWAKLKKDSDIQERYTVAVKTDITH